MNSQNILVFLAIAEYHSISGAANALFLSQSAVSRSLNQLEKTLGTSLVHRNRGSRQLKLTSEGERFLPLAKQQREVDMHIQQFVRSLNQASFRLAANATAHHYLIPEISQNLMRKSSHLELHLLPCLNKDIPKNVEQGLFDAAFLTSSVGDDPPYDIIKIPFYRSSACILCSADTKLPDRLISPHELNPRFEIRHSKLFKKTGSIEWHRRYFSPNISPQMECSTLLSIDNYLTDPRSWAVVPLAQAHYFCSRKPGQLVIRHLNDVPYHQACTIVISKTYTSSAVLDTFMQCCHEYLVSRPYLINCLPPNAPREL